MAKANPDPLQSDRLEAQTSVRHCDHPGCAEAGEYRAPRARDRLDDYFWFCLDHVREYNRSWNYYAGMSDSEVEADLRRTTTWDRPTWRFGAGDAGGRGQAFKRVRDPFELFDDDGAGDERRAAARPSIHSPEGKAFSIMGLEPPLSLDQLKRRYKELVKKHHPDANGGDRAAEERLKSINEAYTTLRRFLG
jgi:DnaJ-domain-containing protein 1